MKDEEILPLLSPKENQNEIIEIAEMKLFKNYLANRRANTTVTLRS